MKRIDNTKLHIAAMDNQDLIKRSLDLMRTSIRVVKKALPNTDPELIGGFFADLLNLWETGQALDKELKKLTKFRFPQDRERLYYFLIWIAATQIETASYWIGEIKKDLPKLLRALDKLKSAPPSGKQKRKHTDIRPVKKRKITQRANTIQKRVSSRSVKSRATHGKRLRKGLE